MSTEKDYTDADFTSRTGLKDAYSLLHTELKEAGHDVKSIYQDGDGCKIVLNSDLADWAAIDAIITNHTAEQAPSA